MYNKRQQLFRLFMMAFIILFLIALVLLSVLTADARAELAPQQIVINEVAWAGSQASPNDEWIELYNPTDYTINLDGWLLYTLEGSIAVSLDGLAIGAEGYLLLERHEGAVSDVTADLVYGGSPMNNSLEELHLRDSNGAIVSIAKTVCTSSFCGWPAGSQASPPYTMERGYNSEVWHSNDGIERNGLDSAGYPINGTPRQRNSQWPVIFQMPVSVYIPLVANGD